MTIVYSYTVSVDFGGSIPKITQLHSEISADVGITSTLVGINSTGDTIDIIFESALSGGEQTTLDALVANHSADNTPYMDNNFSFEPKKSYTNHTSYTRLGQCVFPGATACDVRIISYMDKDVTSYSVKIINKNTGDVIVELTGITNEDEDTIYLGAGSNVPSSKAIFEVHAKKDGGKKEKYIYLELVEIEHD
jgi:hypothetical protein